MLDIGGLGPLPLMKMVVATFNGNVPLALAPVTGGECLAAVKNIPAPGCILVTSGSPVSAMVVH